MKLSLDDYRNIQEYIPITSDIIYKAINITHIGCAEYKMKLYDLVTYNNTSSFRISIPLKKLSTSEAIGSKMLKKYTDVIIV